MKVRLLSHRLATNVFGKRDRANHCRKRAANNQFLTSFGFHVIPPYPAPMQNSGVAIVPAMMAASIIVSMVLRLRITVKIIAG
jgi:hypothetical protein